MGYVYNNPWEAFCKTYFELHGYFVNTNLFAALVGWAELENLREDRVIPDELLPSKRGDARTTKIEADLVAYRIPGTDIGHYPLDTRQSGADPVEFFAGDVNCSLGGTKRRQELIYVEVRANMTTNEHASERQITSFFRAEREKVERMSHILSARFGRDPLVVIMGYEFSDASKKRFRQQGRWMYKTFGQMFEFMDNRMGQDFEIKKRVQYNDPVLEMLRFTARKKRLG